jgi:hypothetical protein
VYGLVSVLATDALANATNVCLFTFCQVVSFCPRNETAKHQVKRLSGENWIAKSSISIIIDSFYEKKKPTGVKQLAFIITCL